VSYKYRGVLLNVACWNTSYYIEQESEGMSPIGVDAPDVPVEN